MADTVILAEQTVSVFVDGIVEIVPAPFVLTDGETYRVIWDGTEHTCVCYVNESIGVPMITDMVIGENGMLTSGTFGIMYGSPELTGAEGGVVAIEAFDLSTETGLDVINTSHTLAIYHVTGEETPDQEYLILGSTLTAIADAIRSKAGGTTNLSPTDMPEAIASITGGGGSNAEVVYITFMSHDGATELYKKPVVPGDDSFDPVTNGLINTPARESSAQYHYTFAGWATTANGGLNVNALKAVTADRTVYANYVATTRYYTVRFFDGETLLSTQSVAFGADAAAPAATKEGYQLDGWQPGFTNITADTDCFAQWSDTITFANATWEQIAEICDAGEAADYFAVGDTKTFNITVDGLAVPSKVKIVGINHDDLADGSGKAPLSIMFFTMHQVSQCHTATTSMYLLNLAAWQAAVAFVNYLPSELQSIIKTVTKKYNRLVGSNEQIYTVDCQTWLPSAIELTGTTTYLECGSQYAAFTSEAFGTGTNAIYDISGNQITGSGWVRNRALGTGDITRYNPQWSVSGTACTIRTVSITSSAYIGVGFCI